MLLFSLCLKEIQSEKNQAPFKKRPCRMYTIVGSREFEITSVPMKNRQSCVICDFGGCFHLKLDFRF